MIPYFEICPTSRAEQWIVQVDTYFVGNFPCGQTLPKVPMGGVLMGIISGMTGEFKILDAPLPGYLSIPVRKVSIVGGK